MPESVRTSLAEAGKLKRYRAGEYLWRVGDLEDCLQVVAEGTVHIGVLGPDGEEIVLHVVARGGCMGEPSVYSPEGNRKTDGRAVGRTTVVEVPGDAVRAALETSLPAMRVFVRRVSEITREHSDRVALTAFYDARSRLARLLRGFAESHGVATPEGRRIELPLSQRTLAGLIGVRRESVNRLIAEFERQGALRFEEGIITILNDRMLRSVPGVGSTCP